VSPRADRKVPDSARELALLALGQWRAGAGFADAILARLLKSSDLITADRNFSTELFYGVLRNLNLLDYWIGLLRPGQLHPDVRDLLRLGLYQLFLLNTPQHAAVYETVELASAKTRSLVNALLRKALRDRDELEAKARQQSLAVRYSHPQFLIDRWMQNFGTDNTTILCEWNNRPPPIYARINRLKLSIDAFFAQHSDAERIEQRDNFVRFARVPHESLVEGECYIQDPSTAGACLLLDPKPGEKILDACAAPGGKTGYLAELMQNRGTIVACDRDANRVMTLQSNLGRLGVNTAQFVQHDWTGDTPPTDAGQISSFDRILVDAPCSNTGVMRRRVDLRWRLTPKEFERMQKEQLQILGATIPLLKAGGTLVYSTCSIEPEENEQVVKIAMQEFPFLEFVEQTLLRPFQDGFDGAFAAKLIRLK
jgi:16S rRNA (cytosine967-C5)-methyltransferase